MESIQARLGGGPVIDTSGPAYDYDLVCPRLTLAAGQSADFESQLPPSINFAWALTLATYNQSDFLVQLFTPMNEPIQSAPAPAKLVFRVSELGRAMFPWLPARGGTRLYGRVVNGASSLTLDVVFSGIRF